MFKRLLWLVIGAGFGFGTAFFVLRHLRATVERYRPERISADLSGAITQLGRDLRAAAHEGRLAMQEREEALRADLAARPARTSREGGRGRGTFDGAERG